MFGGLGLRTGFVTSDEEECSVHDCSSVKHCSHENVVSRTVNKGDMADELHTGVAAGAFAGRIVLLVGTVGPIAPWSRAGLVFALVNLRHGMSVRVRSGGRTVHTFALAYPSLMVMLRTSSFLNRTVMTPDIAFTTVDFPCATCPIVPVP